MSKTLIDLDKEKCPNCPAIGSVQLMMDEPICSECLKPWIKPKPYALYILLVTIVICGIGFGAHFILK